MLADVRLEKTKVTPAVTMIASQGTVDIEGESYPENSVEFYQPIFDWLERFAEEVKTPLMVRMKLTYFNTSSSKCLLDLLDILQSYHNRSGGAVKVEWHYHHDDEDMLESGREFSEDLDLDFTLIAMD